MFTRSRQRREGVPARGTRGAFTLIELLISIAIVSLLIGLLMPALGRARERTRATACMANLRSVGQATAMYLDDETTTFIPWYTYPQREGCDFVAKFTPWVFGGFTAPAPKSADTAADSSVYPVEVRPLNRFLLDPSAGGFEQQIAVFKCPSDRSSSVPIVDDSDPSGKYTLDEDKARPSWVANGSSYTLNTRFMDQYAALDSVPFDPANANEYGRRIAPRLVGGGASRFVMWAETDFYTTTCGAGKDFVVSKAPNPRIGWHMEHSRWSVGFADGHADYRPFDTRLGTADDWTIWDPR